MFPARHTTLHVNPHTPRTCASLLTSLSFPAAPAPPTPHARVLQPCALVLQPSGKIAATQRLMLSEPPAVGADACGSAVPNPPSSGCWEYRFTDEGTAASAQSLFEADAFSNLCQVSVDPRAAAQDL